jgi:L-alanine-DL-glutamate epimerase-like enolase superfamily enzyme
VYVHVIVDGVSGWGEVSPHQHEILGDPGIDEVVDALRAYLTIALASKIEQREWSRAGALANGTGPSRWAAAAVESAMLDLELTRRGVGLDAVFPTAYDTPALSTTSLLDGIPELRTQRVRVKTTPDAAYANIEWLKSVTHEIVLDFNGSATSLDQVVELVQDLGVGHNVVALEQPFGVGDIATHSLLAREISIPVSLDESVRTGTDLRLIASHRAAKQVCIKVARVGGPSQAYSMARRASSLGLLPYIGGFFDSPFARNVSRAIAQAVTELPSDIASVESDADGLWSTRGDGVGVTPTAEFFNVATELAT